MKTLSLHKTKKTLLTIFAVTLLATTQAAAQTFSVHPLSMDNGLSCNYVVDIEQDRDGYLWFATDEGLNRFDGSHFYTYYKGDANGLPSSELNCLLADQRENTIWIGTKNDGLVALDITTETCKTYRHDDGNETSIATNDITHLAHAVDASIWVTTYWQGLEHFDPTTGVFSHFNTNSVSGLPDNQLWCVLDPGGSSIFVGHVRSGLSVINIQNHTAHNYQHSDTDANSIAGNEVNCIARDQNGLIWVGTDQGLDLFDVTAGRFTHVAAEKLGNSRIYDIRQLTDGRIVAATEMYGIAVISPHSLIVDRNATKSCVSIGVGDTDENLTGNSVRSLHEDQFGNVWAGLYGGGVNCLTTSTPPFIQPGTNRVTDTQRHLPQMSAMSVVIAPDSTIWTGSDGGGVTRRDTELHPISYYEYEVGKNVHAALKDSRGRIWFGSFTNGAHVMNLVNGKPQFTTVKGVETEDVRCFVEKSDGIMLLGTSHGIYEVDMETLAATEHRHHVGNDLIRTMAFDRHQRLWVGYFGHGIEILSPDLGNVIRNFRTDLAESPMLSNSVNHIICDSHGIIWAATNEGVMVFDINRGEMRIYQIANELDNKHARALAEDHDGNMWVSTNRGISVVRRDSKTVLNFDSHSGIITTNFNDGSVAFTASGDILMGSARGLCRFSAARVLAPTIAPAPHITSLSLVRNFDEPDSVINLTNRNELTLNHDQNTFTINFATQDYTTNPYVEYCYTISGLQREYAIAEDGFVTLRDLSPGEYKLAVHSRLSNQPWNEAAATLTIIINPPMWLTWWAKSIYILILLAIAALILRSWRARIRLKYQIRAEQDDHQRKEKLNEERLRFFTNITHELRTPLTLIIGPLEDLSREKDIPEATRHKLAVIHQSARRLSDLINQTLEFRKTETNNRKLKVKKANIVDAVREEALKYEELSQKPDVKFRFVAPEPDITIYFDPEVIRTCADNIISNAVKYTDRGSIDICVERKQEEGKRLVEIAISDTGCGISSFALPHIFERYYQESGAHQASGTGIGLALSKNLIDLHGGTISVKSKLGEGTTFVVTLSEDEIYPDALHTALDENLKTEEATETDNKTDEKTSSTEAKQPYRIKLLCVEDNKEILDYIRSSFADEYEILTATNGREGLALDSEPDIIISDIMMPQMDGNQMTRALKNDIRTSHIPIILLTAKDSLDDKEEGYNA